MPNGKIKPQLHVLTINAPGQEVPIDIETDKLYNTCTGINVLLSDDNAKFSTLQLDINSTEVYPENFEVARIKVREGCPIDFDYHTLNETAGGSRIKGKYIDRQFAQGYPYTVSISFRLENK